MRVNRERVCVHLERKCWARMAKLVGNEADADTLFQGEGCEGVTGIVETEGADAVLLCSAPQAGPCARDISCRSSKDSGLQDSAADPAVSSNDLGGGFSRSRAKGSSDTPGDGD